jgi:hypothetical protein
MAQDAAAAQHRHLLAVWSPIVDANAMEQHLRILQDAARQYHNGRLSADDVYVWWGKLRSPNRQVPLPHLDAILATETESTRDDPGEETHLYLTDYSSLYVAHLGEVRREPPSRQDKRVPPLYWTLSKRLGKKRDPDVCDCWFRLWDIRRLVEDDTAAVAHEIRKLRNVRYEGRPVSLYGGMVDLPLIVTSDDPVRYFDAETRRSWTGGQFWVEFDAEYSGTGAIEKELRENLFGQRAWNALDPTTRTFIASGERMFRANIRDQMFDLGLTLLEFAKALEVRCNTLLRTALADAPPTVRWFNRDGASVDVSEALLSLGELARYLSDREVATYLCSRLRNGGFISTELPVVIGEVAELRNSVAHGSLVEREDVVLWRNRLCGVGCDGVLTRLALAAPKDRP